MKIKWVFRFFFGVFIVWPGSCAWLYAEPKKGPIEVQVEVTEVDHVRASSLGIEWVDRLGVAERSPFDISEIGIIDRLTGLHADLHFLMEEGAAELLANPNLVTDSGTTATFRAGGEIPYIMSSALGSTHVEFKPYGVTLEIRPVLLASGHVQMKIKAAVSSPDQTSGVMLSGNRVPALLDREATSNVTVSQGTTVTLAGLVQTQKDETVRGVPVLRKLPLLGALFRWKTARYRRSTVIMFVTPHVREL